MECRGGSKEPSGTLNTAIRIQTSFGDDQNDSCCGAFAVVSTILVHSFVGIKEHEEEEVYIRRKFRCAEYCHVYSLFGGGK